MHRPILDIQAQQSCLLHKGSSQTRQQARKIGSCKPHQIVTHPSASQLPVFMQHSRNNALADACQGTHGPCKRPRKRRHKPGSLGYHGVLVSRSLAVRFGCAHCANGRAQLGLEVYPWRTRALQSHCCEAKIQDPLDCGGVQTREHAALQAEVQRGLTRACQPRDRLTPAGFPCVPSGKSTAGHWLESF